MAPSSRTAVEVETQTETAQAEADATYEELVSQTSIDRRLLTGPFATNVWGGRFEVTGFAGEGSQGVTFVGRDRKTGERVALKVFDLGKAKDWKAQELFDREAQTLKKLSHPGVPRFLDVVTDDDTGARVLVMGYLSGEPLGALVAREGQLPEKRLWSIAVDAAHILSAVHGEGVVHRDLKPDNLILKDDGTLAIVDFGGVGRVRAQAGSTVVGTFGFMAPEQLYGAQTPATDLYALGATLLMLATNKSPEDHPRAGLALDVDAAAPWLSEPLRALLKALLSPDPAGRPKDGAELLARLQNIATQKGSATKTPDVAISKDGRVEARWPDDRQDAEDLARVTGGVLGVVMSIVAMVATVGVGRVIVPFVVSLIAAFVNERERVKLQAFLQALSEKTTEAQRLLLQGAERSASQLEANDRQRARDRERRTKRERKRIERAQWLDENVERLAKEAVDRKLRERSRREGRTRQGPVDAFWRD
jgi:hypothetical protein